MVWCAQQSLPPSPANAMQLAGEESKTFLCFYALWFTVAASAVEMEEILLEIGDGKNDEID